MLVKELLQALSQVKLIDLTNLKALPGVRAYQVQKTPHCCASLYKWLICLSPIRIVALTSCNALSIFSFYTAINACRKMRSGKHKQKITFNQLPIFVCLQMLCPSHL